MYGKLSKIPITDKLIERVAINQFYGCNDHFKWNDLSDFDKGMWLDDAVKSLEKFNDLVMIFDRVNFKCWCE